MKNTTIKKVLAFFIILSALLSVGFLVGCGDSDSTEKSASTNEKSVDNENTSDENNENLEEDNETIPPDAAIDLVGETVTVRGRVKGVSYRDDLEGQPLFVNLGADYPDKSRCQIVVWGENQELSESVQSLAEESDLWEVYGTIEEYDGVAQIEVSDPSQIEPIN